MNQQTERAQEAFRAQQLFDRGRQIRRDAQMLTTTLEEAVGDVTGCLRQQTQQHPYRSLAAAAGVGYVIGGGLASRMTKVVLGIGGRLALAIVARELSGLLQPGAAKVAGRAAHTK